MKQRTIPLRILVNEALLRRLPPNHPKRQDILKDLLIKRAGFKGEQDMDYYISLLDDKDFYIFQDLRIPLGPNYFQIDFLLLSTKFALLIENKNMPGIIEFDPDFNQVLRKHNDQAEVYDDPVLQVKRQIYQFRNWLINHQLTPLPLEFLVTYSNTGSILQNPSKNQEIYDRVCKGGKLVFKVAEYQQRHQKEILSMKEIKKLTKLLIKSHEPKKATIDRYNISPSEILPGVLCPACSRGPMERISGKWFCPQCKTTSTSAHEQAILDYLFLLGPTITNKQLRRFLLIPSRTVATYLLGNMNLQHTGGTKNRVYSNK
ncbi:nuclease-related domain-containing protein [Mesobacillus jeotgali]|uniref:Nuclease-related domain-containing protein n=1 Tax=Mesobacillus jeotgali TaxID=129985 RepID=A0ABY9VMW0_9BACI|nr:nuclease-related domain-containing protein [Mesobacillus jeotgali]WNF25287.1 nuclease-related domain-containing protein [Mesobacillus jeotgali]